VKYAFIQAQEAHHPVRRLCAVLAVHHSGYYAWRREPHSKRSQDDRRVSVPAHQSWIESGRVYGYRKVCNDLRALGERCGKHRVARLMRQAGWKFQTGYTRRPGLRSGKPAVVAPNHLKRAFDVA
jgi:putative transposase